LVSKRRLFTVREVNALIPRLEIIMERLQRHSRTLHDHVVDVARQTGERPENLTTTQLLELRPTLRREVEEVQALLEEVGKCGGELKGIDLGLVDFPTEIDGDVVLLCWQYGEKEVSYFHSPDAGFGGRKPLDTVTVKQRYLQ
jgi:hypothetical protein